ncbi:MAG: hypothetical protein Kow0089_02590 [Desulfobulbaceae bacterium]
MEEQARDTVERAYLDILQRYPDERGLYTYMHALLEEGKSEAWLRQVLLASPEGRDVAARKRTRTRILYGIGALPLVFIGLAYVRRKNFRDFLLTSLLVVCSVLAACLALEIGLRVIASHRAERATEAWSGLSGTRAPEKNAAVFLRDIIRLSNNPRLVYELLPSLSVRFMGGRVTTDERGFRVTPGSCAEGKATKTIIGLGDSVMFGWGVNDEETYLSRMGEALDSCVRVVNMAVPGYNTTMEVEALAAKGLELHPDLVLIHFVDNDLSLPNFIRRQDTHVTLTRSYLLAELSRWRGTRRRTRPFEHLVRNAGEVPEEYRYMVGTDAFRRALERLKKLADANGFRVLLLSNWEPPAFVREAGKDLSIPVIDLGEPLLRYCREHDIPDYQGSVLTISKHDPHYSPLAHRIVAEKILSHLRENGLP